MFNREKLHQFVNSGYMLIACFLVFLLFAGYYYPLFPEGYWIASLLFILFGSKTLSDYWRTHKSSKFKSLSSGNHRFLIAAVIHLIFIFFTWLIVSSL